jgi:hypothetical protein
MKERDLIYNEIYATLLDPRYFFVEKGLSLFSSLCYLHYKHIGGKGEWVVVVGESQQLKNKQTTPHASSVGAWFPSWTDVLLLLLLLFATLPFLSVLTAFFSWIGTRV